MASPAKQILAAVLALVGLAIAAVGLWFTLHLGPSGAASFTVQAKGDAVVLGPDVLNRVDQPVDVSVRTARDGPIWMGLVGPSDARAVVGSNRHLAGTGVLVRNWTLLTSNRGNGAPLVRYESDLWRQQTTGNGSARIAVHQQDAPESLVISTADAPASTVTMTVRRSAWFWEALTVTVIGVLLVAASAWALWRTVRGSRCATAEEAR